MRRPRLLHVPPPPRPHGPGSRAATAARWPLIMTLLLLAPLSSRAQTTEEPPPAASNPPPAAITAVGGAPNTQLKMSIWWEPRSTIGPPPYFLYQRQFLKCCIES